MSDIVRMLRVSESDPVQQEAADEIERLTAERDALRALLKEARDAVLPLASQEHRSIWSISPSMMRALAAVYGRIDAALNKGGGDE